MANLDMPQTLSARQIDWCRQNIKSFSAAWLAVQCADAHRRAVYEKLGLKPDGAPQWVYPMQIPRMAAVQQSQLNTGLLAFC